MSRPDPLPDDWFLPGDIVSRLGNDNHIVVATNERPGDSYPPDLLDVVCVDHKPDAPAFGPFERDQFVAHRCTLIKRGPGFLEPMTVIRLPVRP
jgi:hypothetical protein